MIRVTAAVIEKNNKILIAQRKKEKHLGLKWEFPGGKIDDGESPESCLRRELKEEFGIETKQKTGFTGVWVNDDKICAMGVRLSRWVTMHGFALNINPDMIYFDGMIPCGIFEYGVTSMKEQGIEIDVETLLDKIIQHFNDLFIKTKNEV